MINSHSVISKKQNLIESNFQDSIMLYDVEKGKYYVLNEIGSLIWGQLEEKKGIAVLDIIEKLILVYPQESYHIEEDVITFIEDMILKEIVHLGG